MATEAQIIAMRENVIAPDPTLALLIDLRAQGGVGPEAADLIEWFIDTKADYVESLRQAREDADHFKDQADGMAALLSRLHDHLQSLAAFSLERIADDPWPEPVKPARKRRVKA